MLKLVIDRWISISIKLKIENWDFEPFLQSYVKIANVHSKGIWNEFSTKFIASLCRRLFHFIPMPPLLHTLHIEEGTLLLNSVSVCFPSLNITMFSRQDVFPCVAWLALPVSLQAQITNNTSFYWDEAEGTKYITHVSSPKPFVQISIFIIWYLFWLPLRRALEVFFLRQKEPWHRAKANHRCDASDARRSIILLPHTYIYCCFPPNFEAILPHMPPLKEAKNRAITQFVLLFLHYISIVTWHS